MLVHQIVRLVCTVLKTRNFFLVVISHGSDSAVVAYLLNYTSARRGELQERPYLRIPSPQNGMPPSVPFTLSSSSESAFNSRMGRTSDFAVSHTDFILSSLSWGRSSALVWKSIQVHESVFLGERIDSFHLFLCPPGSIEIVLETFEFRPLSFTALHRLFWHYFRQTQLCRSRVHIQLHVEPQSWCETLLKPHWLGLEVVCYFQAWSGCS